MNSAIGQSVRRRDKQLVGHGSAGSADLHILSGSTASGTNRREVAYKTEVLTDLVYKRNCRNDRRVRIPVQGSKLIAKREKTCVIDFGNGECDAEFELRCDNDESTDLSMASEG